MDSAIEIAKRGDPSPNPHVGCLVVKAGRDGPQVLAETFHQAAGEAHAEQAALERVGAEARGATVYVTLEPCNHHGRTPPCVDALIAAGVARVVVAITDPDPLVAGAGVAALRAQGIEVEVGVGAGRAELDL